MEQSAILAKEKAESLGLTMTSSWRSKAKEASLAGGSANSMHTMGSLNDPKAYDYAGSKTAMAALAAWAKDSGMFTEVIYNSPGHYNHVHLGWAQGKHETPYYYIDGVKSTGESKIGETQTSGVSRTWTENDNAGLFQNIVTIVFVIFFIVVGAAFFLQAFPQVTTATNKTVKSVKKASSNVKKVTKAVKKKKGGDK